MPKRPRTQTPTLATATGAAPAPEPAPSTPSPESPAPQEAVPWFPFIGKQKIEVIKARFIAEAKDVVARHDEVSSKYACLWLFDPRGSIGSFSADQIYKALLTQNPANTKDVLLLLLSGGGRVESAYQIAKLCRRYSKGGFIVAVPRQAKSAATLVSLGARQIHMGPLGQLGPIDPQLDGLPALGVVHALKTIAQVAEQHPGSAQMLATYLEKVLTVEQIGYCERIGESAVQYAERLLTAQGSLPKPAAEIARELVYAYKHHGFVIDFEEAQAHLGAQWIVGESDVLNFAEDFYSLFEEVELGLNYLREHDLRVIGDIEDGTLILDKSKDK